MYAGKGGDLAKRVIKYTHRLDKSGNQIPLLLYT